MVAAPAAGDMQTLIDKTYPPAELGEAFRFQAPQPHFGWNCASL
tara:strand:+ start:190 stop:321 length:132 start_codon:yes stop_codon:yes gene_type:complete